MARSLHQKAAALRSPAPSSGWRAVTSELAALADRKRGAFLQTFFKTGPGEYAEGDQFLGISVPEQRKVALRHRDLELSDIARLLASGVHEERFCAFEILVWQYEHAEADDQERIFQFYLDHARCASNWDLVDTSAPYIVGAHLQTRSKGALDKLAASESIWERRIAMVATLGLIKTGHLASTFRIASRLLGDKQDLIHKAVGWTLREAGKVSEAQLVEFLAKNYRAMPRTALRYAIERFPPERRKRMLAGDFSEA